MTQSNNSTLYEQPLNERMRSFLRLEHLYRRFDFQVVGTDEWAHRGALEALIEIIALIGRADIKTEFIKELERHSQTLEALESNPRVDHERLSHIQVRVRAVLAQLRAMDLALGQELRSHDLITTVRQRSSIPAGTCDFDVPTLQNWLRRPVEEREHELRDWLDSFRIVRDSVEMCLGLVRESALATTELARAGFFQKQLEGNTPCQLVRVQIPSTEHCYTEISAGKHRFTVRFMEHPDADARPVQCTRDIHFELLCCMI